MGDRQGIPFPHYGEEMAAKRRLRRINRILGTFLLLIIAIPTIGWVALDQYASHQLKKTLRKIEKAGYGGNLASMAPPAVPSTANAAPLYEAAFASIGDVVELSDYGWVESDHTPDDERQIHDLVGHCDLALELARMARKQPYCRFDRDYSGRRVLQAPAFSPTRALATALSHRAMTQAAEGRAAEARETMKDLWALAHAFEDEPLDWSQTQTRLLWESALEATVICSRHSVSVSDWREWQALIPDPARLRAAILRSFRGELALWAEDARRGHPLTMIRLFPDQTTRWMVRLARPGLSLGAVKGLSRFQKTLARLESSELTPETLNDFDPHPYLGYVRISMIDYECRPISWLRSLLTTEAQFAVARAGMECERYHAAEGVYPEVLVERDPMTGKPLKYSPDRTSLSSTPPVTHPEMVWHYEEDGLTWMLLHPAD